MSQTETDAEEEQKTADPSDEQSDSKEAQTDSPARRWWLTNDMLALGLVASLVGIVAASGYGLLDLQSVPEMVLGIYSVAVGSSIIWAFGADVVEAWRGGS